MHVKVHSMNVSSRWGALCAIAFSALALAAASPACALGTARIQQKDGSVKVYKDVYIRIKDRAMAIVSSDGQGRIVFGKAACTKVGPLIQCLPYDAILEQYGQTRHIPLQTGMVWFNPTEADQTLSHSSTKLPPRGVLLAVHTKAGTYVSLNGVVDEVKK